MLKYCSKGQILGSARNTAVRRKLWDLVISGLRWYASDQYGLLITVGYVGGDFSQTC